MHSISHQIFQNLSMQDESSHEHYNKRSILHRQTPSKRENKDYKDSNKVQNILF
jgi:hypothetical protein